MAIDVAVATSAITVVGTLGGVGLTLWSTERRERRNRYQAERAAAANRYFLALGAYRRALRDKMSEPDIVNAARSLADAAVLMEVFFDEQIEAAMKNALDALDMQFGRKAIAIDQSSELQRIVMASVSRALGR